MSFSVKRGLGEYICDRKLKIDNILLICTEFEFVVRNNQGVSKDERERISKEVWHI